MSKPARAGAVVLSLAIVVTVAFTLGRAGPAPVTGSGDPGDPRIDSRALAVLEASDAAFAKSEQLYAVYEMTSASERLDRSEKTELRLARPNLYHVKTTQTYAFEGPASPDDPTVVRRESTSEQIIASDGSTKWSVRATETEEGPSVYCSTSEVEPRNEQREVDTFNPVHWSFFDLGQWHIRSALVGHWSSTWRMNDPGLRSIEYIGKDEVNGVPVEVVEWRYTIAYNYPDDDPLYTSRLYIGEDGFPRKIVSSAEGGEGSVAMAVNKEEVVTEIREMGKADPADYAYAPPEGADCKPVDPDHGLASGKYADLPAGTKAPDFTLKTAMGETITLSELAARNKAVLMIFWGYGCAGCRVEMPHVEKLHRELKDKGLTVLTVTYDSAASVRRMVEYNGITHPIAIDPSGRGYEVRPKVYQAYNAYDGKHYIIDPQGRIAGAVSKYGISIPMIKEELKKFGIE